MTLDQIAGAAVVIVGLLGDDFDLAIAKGFARVRHQLVYESFDWKAAQDIISVAFAQGEFQKEIPSAENVISARWSPPTGPGNFLDPVSETFLFESLPELIAEEGRATGTPKYFLSRFVPSSGNMAVGITPIPNIDGHVFLLIKRKFDPTADSPLVPNIDEVLLQFVVADLWEYMRQVGRSQTVLGEAKDLLAKAQQRDVPSTPKPRTSKNLTPGGDTLGDMTNTVCDIVGRWEPDIRESIRDRIRREYRRLYDTLMLPESLLIARVAIGPDQQQVVLPHFIERVVAVRTNKDGPLTQITPLKNQEIQYFFDTNFNIFEQSGEPLYYTMLPSLATDKFPTAAEKLEFSSTDPTDEGVEIYVKGFTDTAEDDERVRLRFGSGMTPPPRGVEVPPPTIFLPPLPPDVTQTWTRSRNSYSSTNVITKPDTKGTISVRGATSHIPYLTLKPDEHERKHLRIWLLPNKGASGISSRPGSIVILGKAKMSPLRDEGDSPQVRNVSNAIVNAAASSIFDRLGNAEQSALYAAKAVAEVNSLIEAETKQNSFQPVITPFVDAGFSSDIDCF